MNPQLKRVLKEQDRIQQLAKKRMIIGDKKHGSFHPERDKRDFYQEMKEEALDIRNYADMLFMRIEAAENEYPLAKLKGSRLPPTGRILIRVRRNAMVLWVKRRVKVYHETDKVPARWRNLTRNEHVTTFRHYYLNMANILVEQYGLSWDDKILVQTMTTFTLPHFKRYRKKPRKVFYGTVREFRGHVWKFFDENVWDRKQDGITRG